MDPKFIVNLSGKEYPLYAGILSEAHNAGLVGIETELIQIPDATNDFTAIVKATVRMDGKDGRTFIDYGDANPKNTNARIATALIRMASTRAKGRALRDAINVGQTMLEELPDLEEERPKKAEGVPPHPGFEPEYKISAKAMTTRSDLLTGAKALLVEAAARGVPTGKLDPDSLYRTPNDVLYHEGVGLKKRLDAADALGANMERGAKSALVEGR